LWHYFLVALRLENLRYINSFNNNNNKGHSTAGWGIGGYVEPQTAGPEFVR